MTTSIWYEDRFGETTFAGYLLQYTEVDDELYELLALKDDICDNPAELVGVEAKLNTDKREGYAIYPIKNDLGEYVWNHYPQRLVLCLARGLWG